MVVSTALSYYYNQNYSDYNQKSMDENSTFNWRNLNNSPEMVSRSNLYDIDCTGFASIVYRYSIGYDFSEYAKDMAELDATQNYHYYNYSDNAYKARSNSYNNGIYWQKIYLNNGKGQNTKTIMKIAKKETGFNETKYNPDNSTNEFIYLAKVTSGSADTISELKDEVEGKLKLGDLVIYRNEKEEHGHILVYVGGTIISGKKEYIHATGFDYKIQSSSEFPYGEDKYSVQKTTWDDKIKTSVLFCRKYDKKTEKCVLEVDGDNPSYIAIIRPINRYCTDEENCKINDDTIKVKASPKDANDENLFNDTGFDNTSLKNSCFRNMHRFLRLEQYQYKNNDNTDIINKYNSVNINDTITYRLTLTNNNKDTSAIYNGLTVTAKIPEGTEYVSCTIYGSVSNCNITAPTMVAADGFNIDGYSISANKYEDY